MSAPPQFRIDEAIQKMTLQDFDPALIPGYGVSVLFKPTQTRYMYKVVRDRTESAGVCVLEPGCRIDRKGTGLGGYNDAQVEKHARKVALAFAEKHFHDRRALEAR
jgi:hypothetical protein